MKFDSVKKLLHLPARTVQYEVHRAIVAPYRHWSYMLAIASISLFVSVGLGVYLFTLVSQGELVERPQLAEPEGLVDHARLRMVLEDMDHRRARYEEERGPLPDHVTSAEIDTQIEEEVSQTEAQASNAVDARLESE